MQDTIEGGARLPVPAFSCTIVNTIFSFSP
jgi:hypothetical protein